MADIQVQDFSKFAQGSNPLAMAEGAQNLLLQRGQLGLQQQQMGLQGVELQQKSRELAANQRISELAGAAKNPETGELDHVKWLSSIAKDPVASFQLPKVLETISNSSETLSRKVQTDLNNGLLRVRGLSAAFGSLLSPTGATNPDGSPIFQPIDDKALYNGLSSYAANNPEFANSQMLANFATKIPKDPQERVKFFAQLAQQTQEGQKALEAVVGTPQFEDLGGTKAVRRTPATGAPTLGPSVPKTLTPGEQIQQIPTVGPTGQPGTVSAGALNPGLVQQGTPSWNPFTSPPPEENQLTGQAPMQATAPQGAPVQVQPLPPLKPAFNPTGLKPITVQAIERIGERQKELISAVTNAINIKTQIGEMEKAASKIKTGGFGTARAELGRVLQGLGATPEIYNSVANGSLPNSQVFEKLATSQSASVLRQSIGANRITNFEFSTFLRNNPSLDGDTEAVTKMLNYFKGLAELPILEQRFFSQAQVNFNKDPAKFPLESVEADWNKLATKILPELAKGRSLQDIRGDFKKGRK